uniref:Dihydroxyacetone kinase n=1 Tax=Colletotrichum fructicola (strain Nara gc5) TaxID=1213859 RepID=L2FDI3_COLFN
MRRSRDERSWEFAKKWHGSRRVEAFDGLLPDGSWDGNARPRNDDTHFDIRAQHHSHARAPYIQELQPSPAKGVELIAFLANSSLPRKRYPLSKRWRPSTTSPTRDTAANTLVPRALRALVSANPHLVLSEAERVVANAQNDPSAVRRRSRASVEWVLEAMRLAPSTAGTILLITNYTGDRLHFGLAAERAKAAGLSDNVVVLPATDDVSIGRSRSTRVGRRGMPGHIFTMKILSAAAAEKYSFERCVDIGRAVNDQTVSIGSALDHCHVPGRQFQSLAADACALGAGIHNEPAQQLLTPFPSVKDLVDKMLKLVCDPADPERAFVKFETGDEVTLLINNYGGLSVLELGALTDEVQTQLAATWKITPCRTLTGAFETSLNAPGFSISLVNISAAARQSSTSAAELLGLLDRKTRPSRGRTSSSPPPTPSRPTPLR